MIKNHNIYYLSLSLFGLLAIFILLSNLINVPVFDEFYTASVVNLIVYAFCIIVFLSVYKLPLVSFPILFVMVYGLFHLSTMILTVSESYEIAVSRYDYLDVTSLKVASVVVMLSLAAFMLGAGTANRKSILKSIQSRQKRKTFNKIDYTQAVNFIAYGLYGLSIFIIMYITLTGEGLSISMNQGYRAFIDWRTGSGKLSVTLFMAALNWLLPWSILMILGCAKNKHQLFQCAFFAGSGIILMVLAGDRTAPLSLFILFFVRVYLLNVNLNLVKIAPAMALVFILIPVLSILRHEGFSSWDSDFLSDAVLLEAGDSFRVGLNPISATLIETSLTFQNLMGTVMVVPKHEEYRYGIDYLTSLVVGVPFSGKMFDISPPDNSQWIKSWLFPLQMAGPGFSISAEIYLQFGNIGVFVFFFGLGYILTYGWFYICANADRQQVVMYLLIVMQVILSWVRNEFTSTVRPIVWCWILVFILVPIIQKVFFDGKLRDKSSPRYNSSN